MRSVGFNPMFVAVAIGYGARDYVPFGPSFATEDEGWKWLHFGDCYPMPCHVCIDVVPEEEAQEYLRDLHDLA